MSPAEILQREKLLKRQALKLIRAELQDLDFQCAAMKYRDRLTSRIRDNLDPKLSTQLDLVQSLIDSFGGRLQGLQGGRPRSVPRLLSVIGGRIQCRTSTRITGSAITIWD